MHKTSKIIKSNIIKFQIIYEFTAQAFISQLPSLTKIIIHRRIKKPRYGGEDGK